MNQFFLRLASQFLSGIGLLIVIASLIVGIFVFANLRGDAPDTTRWAIIGGTLALTIQGVFIAAVGQLLALLMNMLEALVQIEVNTRDRGAQ